jgi:hypothetical protein
MYGRAVLRDGPPCILKEEITIEERLTKEMFLKQLRSLLPETKAGAEDGWAEFAHECVEMKHYVDCIEEPDDAARSRWYDTLLASFILLKRDFGRDVAARICNLSLDQQCLYPYEMERAGQDLRDGGNVDTLFQLMEDGPLEAPEHVFPKLQDTAPKLIPGMIPSL